MKNVLLIEDEKVIRQGIKVLLEDIITGYKVMWEASDGRKGLDMINVIIPDIIITDIRMPEMNGIEFISLLRRKLPNIPVIVISGYDDFTYARDALKLGVKDYILKPVNRSELADTLYRIAGKDVEKSKEHLTEESRQVRQIKELISNNLEEELSLQFISKTLNLHPNYISQLFKQKTSSTLSDYILKKRVEKAKDLLQNTRLKVYDIASLAGYSNAKHFSSVFKKVTGQTPNQYRKGL
ncbi:response regulator transcription factor [Salirhabdus salicampi]|uniref:response regulator transcription factor n=1 Tax=Salirhabdus salicampi TaxID=476102 RepID=UPI0020C40FC2|nr:response regulator [Salirhabdus salicampi]MCP8615905.1 response regulator [Salirhabdus salicampi]